MKTYIYRALIERGDEQGWVVGFPDVPEAISQGDTIEEAKMLGKDALGLALLSYIVRRRALPEQRHGRGRPLRCSTDSIETDLGVEPDVAAKLAVLEAFHASGRTKSDLAVILGKDEKEVRRILDPMHATKLGTLSAALEALGRRLVIGVADIDEAA